MHGVRLIGAPGSQRQREETSIGRQRGHFHACIKVAEHVAVQGGDVERGVAAAQPARLRSGVRLQVDLAQLPLSQCVRLAPFEPALLLILGYTEIFKDDNSLKYIPTYISGKILIFLYQICIASLLIMK